MTYKLKILILFILSITITLGLETTINACDSTNFNFIKFYDTKESKYGQENFGSVFDSIVQFCSQSSVKLNEITNDKNGTEEIKVILRKPITFDENNILLSVEQKQLMINSIEVELANTFKTYYKIHVCDSAEVESIISQLNEYGNGITGEALLSLPNIWPLLSSRHKIGALIDISVYDISSINELGVELYGMAEDKRDISVKFISRSKLRYRVTRCDNAEIIWIDEIAGYFEDILYLSFFENALPFYAKQECVIYSVINNGSCAQ